MAVVLEVWGGIKNIRKVSLLSCSSLFRVFLSILSFIFSANFKKNPDVMNPCLPKMKGEIFKSKNKPYMVFLS